MKQPRQIMPQRFIVWFDYKYFLFILGNLTITDMVLLGAIVIEESLMMKRFVSAILRTADGTGNPSIDEKGIFVIN